MHQCQCCVIIMNIGKNSVIKTVLVQCRLLTLRSGKVALVVIFRLLVERLHGSVCRKWKGLCVQLYMGVKDLQTIELPELHHMPETKTTAPSGVNHYNSYQRPSTLQLFIL